MNETKTAYEIHEIVYRHYIRDSVHTIPLEEPLIVQHTQVFQGGQTSPLLVNEMLNRLHSGVLERIESDERKP